MTSPKKTKTYLKVLRKQKRISVYVSHKTGPSM